MLLIHLYYQNAIYPYNFKNEKYKTHKIGAGMYLVWYNLMCILNLLKIWKGTQFVYEDDQKLLYSQIKHIPKLNYFFSIIKNSNSNLVLVSE